MNMKKKKSPIPPTPKALSIITLHYFIFITIVSSFTSHYFVNLFLSPH